MKRKLEQVEGACRTKAVKERFGYQRSLHFPADLKRVSCQYSVRVLLTLPLSDLEPTRRSVFQKGSMWLGGCYSPEILVPEPSPGKAWPETRGCRGFPFFGKVPAEALEPPETTLQPRTQLAGDPVELLGPLPGSFFGLFLGSK